MVQNLSFGLGELPFWFVLTGGFVTAFFLTFIVIPSIVKVSAIKGLYDEPNSRSSHHTVIPTLGGAAVFIGYILSISIFTGHGIDHELKYIIVSLLILFFIGIKDDILIIDPKKKLIAQILAASILSVLGDIRITNLNNIFGITEISYLGSILLTVLVIVFIINGFNLIDGIDGLASGVGILSSLFFGIWFMLGNFISYSIMCFALTGSLMAFFRFNVYSGRNKIFLGDTGSLIIGLIVSLFTIRFLEYNLIVRPTLHIESAPAMVFGVLIIPLFDTMRIIFIRTSQGKSPFSADRQHVHHRMLELGYNHLRSTSIILTFNILFIGLCLSFQFIGNYWLVVMELALASIFSSIPGLIIRRKYQTTITESNTFFAKIKVLSKG